MNDMPHPLDDTPQVTQLPSGKRKAALGFIFATALMDVIALGIMIPVLPNLVKQMVGGDSVTAAHMTGVFATAWGLMQFFVSPIQGMLSDRFGRRPVLLISIFGMSLDYVFMALAPTIGWLFLGRVINGATAASFSTASAYIADVSAPEDRAKNYGVIGAAFGVGFVVGPALGGLLGSYNLRLPFYVAAGLGLINWLYGFFILPESLPVERRQPKFDWRRANPVGSFNLLRRPGIASLGGVYMLFQLAFNVFPSIFVLYVGQRFGWGPREAGYMLMATGAVSIIVQASVVRPAVKRLGERGALVVGLISAVTGYLVYGFAPTPGIFLLGIPAFALSALIGPGIQGLMSRRVPPNEQGQLQGANAGLMGLAAIAGPPLFTGLLAWAIDSRLLVEGVPILVAAALMGLALTLTLVSAPARTERKTPA